MRTSGGTPAAFQASGSRRAASTSISSSVPVLALTRQWSTSPGTGSAPSPYVPSGSTVAPSGVESPADSPSVGAPATASRSKRAWRRVVVSGTSAVCTSPYSSA